MTVRYGISIIPEPTFTARVYRARQLICGQYGAWAAEMQMLHMPLIEFFDCTSSSVDLISEGLDRIAKNIRDTARRFPLVSRGVSYYEQINNDVFLEFTVAEDPIDSRQKHLNDLWYKVLELVESTNGAVIPDANNLKLQYRPHINLMQLALLTDSVFQSAVTFSESIVQDLEIPNSTRVWQLQFIQYESTADVESWDRGAWASDLSWKVLESYSL
jgi:2'-5' RNA ligase